jgi:bifunctional DNase/RNase
MSDGDEVQVYPVGIFEQESEEPQPPLLALRDDMGREMRIPIGACEGLAINVALDQQHFPRPLTHDLALHLLDKLLAKLEHVVIDSLSEDDGCQATLRLSTARGTQVIQARAGDGVALALRAEIPIHVTEEVLQRASAR